MSMSMNHEPRLVGRTDPAELVGDPENRGVSPMDAAAHAGYCTSDQMDLWRQVFAELDHRILMAD